ncbi:SDR family oxidoreductase [Holzapfeliella sp. JNUCC 72]
MNYLITGATGDLGYKTLTYLKDKVDNNHLFALARSQNKADKLKKENFQVRLGDYSQPQTLERAFAAIDVLFFVSGNSENRKVEHQNVVDAAKAMGISKIVYTSLANLENSTSMMAPDHLYTENAIKESGIAHTFLRNNWYLENELPLIQHALQTGDFTYTTKTGKVAWALKREYAEAAANALLDATLPEIVELSGKPKSYLDLVDALNHNSSAKITIKYGNDQDFIDSLTSNGLPNEVAQFFLAIQKDIENNELNFHSDQFEKLLGHPLTPLSEAVTEIISF